MNGFINNIISRQLNPASNIQPRLPGIFETGNFNGGISTEPFTATPEFNQPGDAGTSGTEGHNDPSGNQSMNTVLPAAALSSVNMQGEHIHPLQRSPYKEQGINIIPTEIARTPYLPISDDGIRNNILNKITESTKEKENIYSENEQTGDTKRNTVTEKKPVVITGSANPALATEDFQKLHPVQPSPIRQGMQDMANASYLNFPDTFRQQAIPPVIKISIGRIDVRAISPATPVTIKREPLQKPKMSLEEYLEKRNNR